MWWGCSHGGQWESKVEPSRRQEMRMQKNGRGSKTDRRGKSVGCLHVLQNNMIKKKKMSKRATHARKRWSQMKVTVELIWRRHLEKENQDILRLFDLISSPSVDDWLDEDAQVFPGLSRLVALQADSQACRAGLVEGDLVHQLLSSVLQHQTPSIFTFLEDRKYSAFKALSSLAFPHNLALKACRQENLPYARLPNTCFT